MNTEELELAGMDPEHERPVSETPRLVPDLIRILRSSKDLNQFRSETGFSGPGQIERGDFPCLAWVPIDGIVQHGQPQTTDKGILSSFLQIGESRSASSAANRIQRFARKHGPLQVCSKHRLPASIPGSHHECEPRTIEHLGLWLFYARKARATLFLGRALSDGEFGDRKDWELLQRTAESALDPDPRYQGRWCWAPPNRLPVKQGFRERLLKRCVHEFMMHVNFFWADKCNVRPILGWGKQGPRIGIFATGMLGAVARQLLFALGRVDALIFCSGCGCEVKPKRRPRPNQRSWCDDCRKEGKDKRQADRDYSRRKQLRPRKSGSGHQ